MIGFRLKSVMHVAKSFSCGGHALTVALPTKAFSIASYIELAAARNLKSIMYALKRKASETDALSPDEDIKPVTADAHAVSSVELTSDFPLFDGLLSDRTTQLSAYRRRRSAVNERSVYPLDVDEMLAKGWTVSRIGKRLTRIKQIKPHDQMLEDRAWSLLYLMKYDELNEAGFTIKFRRLVGSLGDP